MLDILNLWNRWGRAKLASGHAREITEKILPFVDTKEVVALIGLRRAGKTTMLYQIMDYLESQGIPKEAMLHMNFEEPALSPVSLETLASIYRIYREEVFPQGKAYIFLDEIQNIPQWEKWVRARNESEDIKIFITGSSAHLMSRELATVLTGRHVEFYVTPFSFKEMLNLKKIAIPSTQLKINPPPAIQKALKEYMTWGGFPEIILSDDQDRKRMLLKQYFDDLLFKDIAIRHQVRDVSMLRNIAIHLLTQTSCLVSINRIAKIFQISLETASHYCHFIQESFLVEYLPFFSLKTSERNRHPFKVHVNDLGFRQIASISFSMDYGKLTETLVFQHLQRKFRNDIFYWKKNHEVDFLIRQGNSVKSIIQVAYENLDDEKIESREWNSLNEATEIFKEATVQLIAGEMPKKRDQRLMPLWQFLLH